MTDNEIIKALKCCKSKGGTCNGCAFGGYQGCIGALHYETIDLINRQKTEIDILIRKNETLKDELAEKQAEIEELKGELIEERTRRKNAVNSYHEAKTETIKELAERLCEDRVSNDPVVIVVKTELKFMEQ